MAQIEAQSRMIGWRVVLPCCWGVPPACWLWPCWGAGVLLPPCWAGEEIDI
ncbi:MAG: hypothetical protein KA139_08825 [Rhodobacteraceae bacterium]|nr:hypothetical protein [Paracoccaceae bacterium]